MRGTYQSNKASADRWRRKNLDKARLYVAKLRAWKSIKIEFLNILI